MQCVFDLDCVLCDLMSFLTPKLNEHTGKSLAVSDMHDYDMTALYGLSSHAEFLDVIVKSEALKHSPPFEKARDTLLLCNEIGIDVNIITARGFQEDAIEITQAWLEEHRLPHKQLLVSGASKLDSFRELGVEQEFFVDDYLKNIHDAHRSGMFKKLFVMSQPWNSEGHAHASHVNDLSHLKTVLRENYAR